MIRTRIAAAALAALIASLASTLEARGDNILAEGTITLAAGSTNPVTQRVVLDNYRLTKWGNVRAVRVRNNAVSGSNTNAAYVAKCMDLGAATTLASGTVAAGATALSIVGADTFTSVSTNASGNVVSATTTKNTGPARIVDVVVSPDTGATVAHTWDYYIYAD